MHKSKAADLQGVPKNCPTFGHSVPTARAINARRLFSLCPSLVQFMPVACSVYARRLFSLCPSLVQSMPVACSLSAHLTGKTGHLMVSYRTAYVILFLILLVNLSSYS